MRIHTTRQEMSKERAANMMHTVVLILYTVECALLFVTWMTLPPVVTATRRNPSGDHATSHTLHDGQKQKMNKWARTPPSHCAVYILVCEAILVMQSEQPRLPVATKVPSEEIAHPSTCKHKQHQTSSTSKAKKDVRNSCAAS